VNKQRVNDDERTRQSGEQGVALNFQIIHEAFEGICRDSQGIDGKKGLIKHRLCRDGIEALDHFSAAIAPGKANTLGLGLAGRNQEECAGKSSSEQEIFHHVIIGRY
jgi:hypothetical protein